MCVSSDIKEDIRQKALELGFEACGFACADSVSKESEAMYDVWLSKGKHDCMDYAQRYKELRDNPSVLFPGGKTVICVALNYYPHKLRSADYPEISVYAYGKDYHEVVREKLNKLSEYIQSAYNGTSRACVDTAPVREKYWAQQAGIGFVGRNNLLIVPNKGSYFFLGELITTLEIEPDEPCTLSCGDCGKCVEACPSGALSEGGAVDARLCLSCQLIERKGDLPEYVGKYIGNHLYGCDECQKCCPHNRNVNPTTVAEFEPNDALLNLTLEQVLDMDHEGFLRVFRHSAVRRAKLAGLQRNAKAVQAYKNKYK